MNTIAKLSKKLASGFWVWDTLLRSVIPRDIDVALLDNVVNGLHKLFLGQGSNGFAVDGSTLGFFLLSF